jgi:hypothetical protein
MLIGTIAVSSVLALGLIATAIRKILRSPDTVAHYARAGVPVGWLRPLGSLLLLAAAGLLAGLAWWPLGVAVGAALVAYFATAIGFHIRNGDGRAIAMPAAFLGLAVAATILFVLGRA